MKIQILREKLYQGLQVIDYLSKRNLTLPILNNLLLETEKNFLKLSYTNLESSIIWRILSKVEKSGKVAIPVSFFKSVISLIKSEQIELKTQDKNLIIETKNEKTQIQGVDPDDFPIIPQVEKKDEIEISKIKLLEGLNQIINIPSPSQIRPEISGIYFWFQKNTLKIVATDSFRLAEKTIPLTKNVKNNGFILPHTTAKELLNILSIKNQNVKLFFNNTNQVLFEWLSEENIYPEINFFSRLIDGEYPDYQEIIPKNYTVRIIVNKDEFLNQIKKAGLFSGKISDVKILILPQKKLVKIFSQNQEKGQTENYLAFKSEDLIDKELEVAFNYRFLIDGLNNIKSSEVYFGLNDSEGPSSLQPVGDNDFIYILMPIKPV